MALVELDDELVLNVLSGHADLEKLWEEIFNQILQAEMSKHLEAERYERSKERKGHLGTAATSGSSPRVWDV